jgi:hypothetical protein
MRSLNPRKNINLGEETKSLVIENNMFYEYTIDDFPHPNPMTSLSVIYISKYMFTHMEFTLWRIIHTLQNKYISYVFPY